MRLFFAFFLLFVGGLLGAGSTVWYWWEQPVVLSQELTVEVREKETFGQVLRELEKKGVARWPLFYKIYARYLGIESQIKPGLYLFSGEVFPKELLGKLMKGQVSLVRIVIPEGFNMYQVAERLAAQFRLTTREFWLGEMKRADFLAKVRIGPPTLEGFLFPQTYIVRFNQPPQEMIEIFLREFQRNFTPDLIEKGERLGLNPLQIVTLASIIEKETAVASERQQISAVFHNRLKKGMRLQTDPTVIYGMWERYDGNIRRKDLETPTPYNTYAVKGLPPGPIANPGRDALIAAVNPDQVPYLYFVAKGDGTHFFSKTLEEHSLAVRKYQIIPARRNRNSQ